MEGRRHHAEDARQARFLWGECLIKKLKCMQPLQPEPTCHNLQQRVRPLARGNDCGDSGLGRHPGCIQLQAGQSTVELALARTELQGRPPQIRSGGGCSGCCCPELFICWSASLNFNSSIGHLCHNAVSHKPALNLHSIHAMSRRARAAAWEPTLATMPPRPPPDFCPNLIIGSCTSGQ